MLDDKVEMNVAANTTDNKPAEKNRPMLMDLRQRALASVKVEVKVMDEMAAE